MGLQSIFWDLKMKFVVVQSVSPGSERDFTAACFMIFYRKTLFLVLQSDFGGAKRGDMDVQSVSRYTDVKFTAIRSVFSRFNGIFFEEDFNFMDKKINCTIVH
jgi:hypothetical protein